jgi:hypothetical protein
MKRASGTALRSQLFGSCPAGRLALLRAAWPHAVGSGLAQRTELLALEGGALRVRVEDVSWRRELHRIRGEILTRLREIAGPLAPRSLGFTLGPVVTQAKDAGRPPEPDPAGRSPAVAPASVIAGAEAIEDPEIRRAFLESAARYLDRSARHPRKEEL